MKKRTKISLIVSSIVFSSISYGQDLVNNIQGMYFGHPGANPVLCVKSTSGDWNTWQNGAKMDPFAVAGNQDWAVMDIRIPADINNRPCDPGKIDNIYLGTVTLHKDPNQPNEYVPADGSTYNNGGYHNSPTHMPLLVVKGPNDTDTELKGPSIVGNEVVGHVDTLQMGNNSQLIQKNFITTKDWYTGVNLSGLEFSTALNASVIPELSSETYTVGYPTLGHSGGGETFQNLPGADEKEMEAFFYTSNGQQTGATTVRLPVRWAYMQPKGYQPGAFDQKAFDQYFTKLAIPNIQILTSKNYNVILDLHGYMHYATVVDQFAGCLGGTEGEGSTCPDGKLVTDADPYVAIWGRMFDALKAANINTKNIMVDIVNEPAIAHKVPSGGSTGESLTAQQVFDMEVAVIKSLKAKGFDGKFLVEGNGWSGLHSWAEFGNTTQFTRENFIKAGIDEATIDNQIIINAHQYLDSDFSGTHDTCLPDINTTGEQGFNLAAFTKYLSDNKFKAMVTEFGVGNPTSTADKNVCENTLTKFLEYMQNNSYSANKGFGFVGWTVWGVGHGWGDYNMVVQPSDWKAGILDKYFKKGGMQQDTLIWDDHTNIKASNITETSVTVSFNPDAQIKHNGQLQSVHYAYVLNGGGTVDILDSMSSISLDALKPSTKYTLDVLPYYNGIAKTTFISNANIAETTFVTKGSTPPVDEGCTANFTVANSWNNGATIQGHVSKTGANKVLGYSISLNVTGAENAVITSSWMGSGSNAVKNPDGSFTLTANSYDDYNGLSTNGDNVGFNLGASSIGSNLAINNVKCVVAK